MLKVLPVTLSGPNGSYETFAFLDDGSTATMIDCKVAARIGLIGPEEFITVNGIMGLQKTTKVRYVDFYIRGKYESDIHLVNRAKAVQSLGLNEQTLSTETIESYAHLKDLAEYLTYADATPTVLIGAEHWHLSICREVCEGRRNEPAACRTLLGWTLYGPTSSKTKPVEFVNRCQLDRTEPSENERLESLIKEQYKLDSLGISKRETLFSKLDSRAVEILDATTTRLPTGRYEVGLPWCDNIRCVPDSYPQALTRFLSLERRMIREPAFADAYKKFIDNMIAKNYAEECNSGTYYNHLITKSVNTSIDLKRDTNLGDYPNKIHTLSDNLQPSTVSPNNAETNFDINLSSPSFLLDPPENWPVEPAGQPIVQEERKQTSGLVVGHLEITADFSRFSDWLRLLRPTARVLQAASKFRSALDRVGCVALSTDVRRRQRTNTPTSTTLIPLTAELMEAAERHVLKKVQSESFSDEIPIIERGELIPKSSRLAKLSPRMGPDNLLHLAGRIVAVRDVGSEIKFPIILDGRHPVVRLLVNFYHRKAGHANNEMVVNEVRQKYWLLHLRSTVRSVTSKCLFCRIKRAKPMNPMTGNFPPQRLAHHRRPFTYTGLGYFGPINSKIGRRQEKRYVALYTCMTSRAVHLELVHSLSADSAIMSLRRFIARRGAPNTVYSDNGTCFVGADRILREFHQYEVYDFAANRGIKWSFIPAAAPFFGGCWERLIRTVKVALNATLREREPNPEVLVTLLLEAEAIVNSRPLTHVPVGPEDQETLTPFHFLIGSSSNQVLPATLDDRDLLRRADWRKALRLADHFWNRWVKEILPTMQPRQIAENREHDLTIGDLVIVVDQNLPRGTWPRGRVVATFPGRDGVVRVVDVATSGGILRRPSKKLVRLEA
ncbi:uncharacterized protein LOC134797347 [Cydia splendana]|uniref:uncharacterized protein LOC134797347 n=1 Tax=Cydia splendana TaxID=1100963 RepID=UPI00300CA2F3